MRFLTHLWKLKLFALFCLISLAYANLKLTWSFPLRSLAFGPSCAFARKRRVFLFSNLKHTFSEKLPMCSSRGRLWISWGYAHDLRMMSLEICPRDNHKDDYISLCS